MLGSDLSWNAQLKSRFVGFSSRQARRQPGVANAVVLECKSLEGLEYADVCGAVLPFLDFEGFGSVSVVFIIPRLLSFGTSRGQVYVAKLALS
eukprot:1630461-Pyramimonas_sp.AAC.1